MNYQKSNPRSGNDKLYIRYRIYAQKSERADRQYPGRAIKSITNLGKALIEDDLLFTRDYRSEDIIERIYIPNDLRHVNPMYFEMIRDITTLFDCFAKWQRMMIPGTIERINTLKVIGYEQDCRLALHYIRKFIDNLNSMRSNIRVRDKSSKFFYGSIDNIQLSINDLLEVVDKNSIITKYKLDTLEYYLKHKELLDFRKYGNSRANLKNAYSRMAHFQNNRIIR